MSELYTLGSYLDSQRGIQNFTHNGQCSNCGGCCSNLIPVSDSDIRSMRRYLRKHKIRLHLDAIVTPQSEISIDLRCPFRDEKHNRCVIYPVRPAICRTFKCNGNEKDIERNKKVFHQRFPVRDLTEEFKEFID